jgi:hypothetical protein
MTRADFSDLLGGVPLSVGELQQAVVFIILSYSAPPAVIAWQGAG